MPRITSTSTRALLNGKLDSRPLQFTVKTTNPIYLHLNVTFRSFGPCNSCGNDTFPCRKILFACFEPTKKIIYARDTSSLLVASVELYWWICVASSQFMHYTIVFITFREYRQLWHLFTPLTQMIVGKPEILCPCSRVVMFFTSLILWEGESIVINQKCYKPTTIISSRGRRPLVKEALLDWNTTHIDFILIWASISLMHHEYNFTIVD